MTNNTNIVSFPAEQFAFVCGRWQMWRANRIIALMIDGMSYGDAVKWSRRYAKQEGAWH